MKTFFGTGSGSEFGKIVAMDRFDSGRSLSPIRQAEAGAAQEMILLTKECFGFYPELLVADTAYGPADMLG